MQMVLLKVAISKNRAPKYTLRKLTEELPACCGRFSGYLLEATPLQEHCLLLDVLDDQSCLCLCPTGASWVTCLLEDHQRNCHQQLKASHIWERHERTGRLSQ